MEFSIEADDQPANSALDRVRAKLTSVERTAVEGFRRMTGAADGFARGVVKVAEATGAVLLARQAFREVAESFTLSGRAANQQNAAIEKSIDLYRGLRLAAAAATGSTTALFTTGATIGVGVAVEEAIRITKRYGESLAEVSLKAAKTKTDIQSAFSLDRAGRILGQDLSALTGKFEITQLRSYLVEVRGIADPVEKAARAYSLFGENAALALSLADKPTERVIDSAFELSAALDGQTRASIERARQTFGGFGGILDNVAQSLRNLREQASQAITVRVAAVVDFIGRGGIGKALGGGFGEGASGEGGFGAGFQNPNPNIVPSLAQIIQDAAKAGLPSSARDVKGVAPDPAARALQAEGRRATAAVREFEGTIDGIKDRLNKVRKLRDDLFGGIGSGVLDAGVFGPRALSAEKEVRSLQAQIDAAEKLKRARESIKGDLESAQEKELKGLDLIELKRQKSLALAGSDLELRRQVNQTAQILIDLETKQLNQKLQTTGIDLGRKARQVDNTRFAQEQIQEIEFSNATVELRQKTATRAAEIELDIARDTRDRQLRQLEIVSGKDLGGKLALEQKRAAIEEKFLMSTFALKADLLDRELKLEIANMEAIAFAKGVSEEQIAARRDSLIQQAAERGRRIEQSTQAEVDAARENAAIRSTQLVVDAQQRAYDDLKRRVEGAFDSLLSRGKTVGEKMKDLLTLPLFSAIKQIAAQFTTDLLAPFIGLQRGAGGGASRVGTGGGLLAGLLGIGSGGGGFGGLISGAPGGTPGFAGPVAGLGGASGGGGGVGAGSIGASLSGTASSLKGILSGLGNIGFGAKGGDFGGEVAGSFKGVGGVKGGAMLAGGAILAFDGLRRGGAIGLAETTAGGALIGAKFGGPLGAAIGAGIGAVAGTIRLFVKGAQEKIVEKVQSVYGIKIDKSFARDPLLGIIKQSFGGNIDVGIRSPQVRDLIELYAMSTGQNPGGINTTRPIASNFSLSGGGLTQLPTFQNGLQVPLNISAPSSSAPVVIQMDPEATTAFLQGQAIETIGNNPRAVQAASLAANRQNASRRENLGLMVNPGLI